MQTIGKTTIKLTSLVIIFILLLPLSTMGQQLLGAITGTVTDSNGAVVPKVEVKVTNKATNLQQTAHCNDDGSFNLSGLPIGSYRVTFVKEGFKTEEFTEVIVQANRTTTLNTSVQAGGVTDTITVTATPLLNQTDTSNGYILGTSSINALPLGTGSFTQLATLAPGVHADLLSGADSNSGLGNQAIYANGQRDTSNSFSINGVNANNLFNGRTSSQVEENRNTFNTGQQNVGSVTRTNTSVYDAIGQGIPTPPTETIQEVRVNTSMYDATQGSSSGAHIQVISRSGSNEFHGQIYDNFQNGALNAGQYFFNATNAITQKTPALQRNVFGGTVGGPIIRDKLFFFGSYQGVRVNDALKGISDISVPFQLTDDRSATTLATQFGVAAIDPAALKILNTKLPSGGFLIPTPLITDPVAVKALGFNAIQQAPASFLADQFTGNIDYNFSTRDRLAGKYYFQRDPTTSPFGLSTLAGFTQQLTAGSQVVSLNNTTIITPNLTWEQKAGYIRQIVFANNVQPLSPADAGMNLQGSTIFPAVSISGVTIGPNNNKTLSFGPSSGISANAGVFQNRYSFSTNLNWVAGRHTTSFGASWDNSQLNIVNNDNQLATLSFNTFNDFLTGTLSPTRNNTLFDGSSSRYYRSNTIGAFAQDNFKLRPNLTVSLGLRFDYNGGLSEKGGLLTNFDPTKYKYDPVTDTVLNTGLVIAGNNPKFGTPGISDTTLLAGQHGIAPRVGIAWSPSFIKNFVVRAGFGIYYDRGEYFTEFSPGAGNGNGGPFGVTRELPFVTQVTGNTGVAGGLSNPFPVFPAISGDPASFSIPNMAALDANNPKNPKPGTAASPFTFGGYDPHNGLPYTENWSFDLQWQPVNDLVMTLGYTGNHGQHELLPIPFNQARIATAQNPINGQTSSYSLINAITGFKPSALEPVKTRDGGNTDLRVPFIGYSPNSVFYEAEGISNYHALLFSVNKRLGHGLQVNGSYTWSHALDEGSGQNLFFKGNDPQNPRSGYGNADFDRTHVVSVGYLYQIPKLVQGNNLLSKVVNDWSIAGITVLESGQTYGVIDFSGAASSIYGDLSIIDPLIPLASGFTAQSAQLQGTHNINPLLPVLNPAAFAVPLITPGTKGVPIDDPFETDFGGSGRNIFRAPFQKRFDMSLSKQIRLTERFNLQWRADFFNVFNHPSFDAPQSSISLANTSITTGPTPGFATPTSTSLGLIQHTLGSPRFIQFSLHLSF